MLTFKLSLSISLFLHNYLCFLHINTYSPQIMSEKKYNDSKYSIVILYLKNQYKN